SHFEELDQTQGSKHFSAPLAMKTLVFKNEQNRDDLLGWHTAPRRQWCITLAGSVEIGIVVGRMKTFGPGEVFWSEDISVEGHTAKEKNWVRAFVHLEQK